MGKEIFSNGDRYQGQYKNGMFHGEGEYFLKNGTFKGIFKENKKQGYFSWKNDKESFEGNYSNGLRDGYGIFRYECGSYY